MIGKFLLILAAFGGFTIGAMIFVTTQLRSIDTSYSAAIDHQAVAAIAIARANGRLGFMRAAIAELEIANTDEDNAKAMDFFSKSRTEFIAFTGKAAAARPDLSAEIGDLRQRSLTLVDVTCAPAIKAGALASDPAAVEASQKMYMGQCARGFPP